jgi:hypothetical protein
MNNNEQLMNELIKSQQDLLRTVAESQQRMQEQQLQIVELQKALTANQQTMGLQNAKIESLGESKNSLTNKSGGIKPPKPEFYRGKRDALEINAWIDQIERYAEFFAVSEGMDRVNFAVFYLAGSARDWWTNRSGRLKDSITGWKDFIKELKITFYPLDHERSVMDKLEKLRQKGSVAGYVESFERLRTQIQGVSDELWKRYFIKGLQPHVQIEAIKYNLDNSDASLAMLYQRATTLGDALWAQKSAHSNNRTDPMDLSATTMVKTNGKSYAGYKFKSGNQKGLNQDGVKCFKCGKFGHFKRDCGQKQLQMINAGVDQQSAASSAGQVKEVSRETSGIPNQIRKSILKSKDFQ